MTAGPQQIIPNALIPWPKIYSTNQKICYRIKAWIVLFCNNASKYFIPSAICIHILYMNIIKDINYFSNIKPYTLQSFLGLETLNIMEMPIFFICNFPNNYRLYLKVILDRNNTNDLLEICMIHKAPSSCEQIYYGIADHLFFGIVSQ